MAINLTGLTTVPIRSREILGNIIVRDTILKKFVVHEGFGPGEVIQRIFSADGQLHECCTVPTDNYNFDEVKARISCILYGENFCEQPLAAALNDYVFSYTAGNKALPADIYTLFTEQILASISRNIDNIVWKGDVDSSDNTLARADGLLKQSTANTPAANKITITSGSAVGILQQIYLSIPVDAWDFADTMDVFVGLDVAQAIRAGLIGQNLYHFNPGTAGNPYDEFTDPRYGTIRIVPTRGLNGVDAAGNHRIIVTSRNNIHWYTALASDYMTLFWGYSEYHQEYFNRLQFLFGITFARYEYVLDISVAPDVITNPGGLPVSIVSPLGAGGGVLTETAAAGGAGAPVTPTSAKVNKAAKEDEATK